MKLVREVGEPGERQEDLFQHAQSLDAQGRDEEARRAYLGALAADSRHLPALLGLAGLLMKTRYLQAAKTVLGRALQEEPRSPLAHTCLATLLADEGETAAACEHYESALRWDPQYEGAHKGLAVLLLRRGETEAARRHGEAGFRGLASPWSYRGTGRPISLVLVRSALGGNVPIEDLVSDTVYRKWTLVPEFCDPGAALPPHDLVWNVVGDADRCPDALGKAALALARSRAPVLNPPLRVLATGRAANAARLSRLPGVVTPRTAEYPREDLAAPGAAATLAAAGFTWPLLFRSPGFQTGLHFVKVDRPEDLPAAVEGLPGPKLLAIQFIDTTGQDGKYRKYRAMMINGKLHPLHLAVSRSWKVHYFSADMVDCPEHRGEDQAFLCDMPNVLGSRSMQALRRIQETLGLDYAGCDFGIDRRGNVVVFEANATMVMPAPAGEAFAYRTVAVRRARRAVVRMILRRARSSIEKRGEVRGWRAGP